MPSLPWPCGVTPWAGCAGAGSQHGKGKRERGQAFFIYVRPLLGMTVGEREGRDEVVRNGNCSSPRSASPLRGKTMV